MITVGEFYNTIMQYIIIHVKEKLKGGRFIVCK